MFDCASLFLKDGYEGDADDFQQEMVGMFEADKVSQSGDVPAAPDATTVGQGKDDTAQEATAPTPLPTGELAALPKSEDIFGNYLISLTFVCLITALFECLTCQNYSISISQASRIFSSETPLINRSVCEIFLVLLFSSLVGSLCHTPGVVCHPSYVVRHALCVHLNYQK